MKLVLKYLLFVALLLNAGMTFSQERVNEPISTVQVEGELKKWHKVTLTFNGPESDEQSSYNPFLNYRLDVTFYHDKGSYKVPGYFAADGNAGESSATSGNKWRVHFSPDQTGVWHYEVSFRKGASIAVSDQPKAGVSGMFMDGKTGHFTILASDKTGKDLRGQGRLKYIGKTYLQFADSKNYFLKVGADAPENLLAYSDFDGDFHSDGKKDNLVKSWAPHKKDWIEGDPSWQNGKGKGLIGAINYLAAKGMNAFSFLPFNIAGDDQNVYPYISYDIYDRMDISKLDQWEIIFAHADELGMFLHFKTSEAENQGLLDNGDLGLQRKLYYRELIARFAHHLALNWNIGEENGLWLDNHPTPWQTTTQRLACARYFHNNDPYNHHIVIHNGQEFYDLLGPESKYTGLSLQTNRQDFANVHDFVLKWRNLSKAAGKNWAIAVDEPGDHQFSLVPDRLNPDHDNARQNGLWGALMAGAWGVEWYFGYEYEHSDLTCEDWRTRDKMWTQSKYALDFFRDNRLPYWDMEPMDDLTQDPNDYVLGIKDKVYVVYQKIGANKKIALSDLSGTYEIIRFQPKSGQYLPVIQRDSNSTGLELDPPTNFQGQDWAIIIRKL